MNWWVGELVGGRTREEWVGLWESWWIHWLFEERLSRLTKVLMGGW